MADGVTGRKRLLLVDDDRNFVTWLRSLLEIEGYEVVCAFDGETALRVGPSGEDAVKATAVVLERASQVLATVAAASSTSAPAH